MSSHYMEGGGNTLLMELIITVSGQFSTCIISKQVVTFIKFNQRIIINNSSRANSDLTNTPSEGHDGPGSLT